MDLLFQILLFAPPILFAITIHEFSHGWVANKLGDPTAKNAGRLTLNPLAHLDPIGTLMLFLVHIGWAKPVPVNAANLKNPKQDMIWVSLAGPGANLITAFIFGMLLKWLNTFLASQIFLAIAPVLVYLVLFNLVLASFNLIPIPPLDGYNILLGILPMKQAYGFSKSAQYGPFILLAIIVIGQVTRFNLLWTIIAPFVSFFSWLFTGQDLEF